MLLITTKNSNIVEDLDTLRLCAKIVTDIVPNVSDVTINEHAFDLISAFDEVITLGYRYGWSSRRHCYKQTNNSNNNK